jgi:hypothetical protein
MAHKPDRTVAEYIIIGNLEGFTVISGDFGAEELYNNVCKDDPSSLMSAEDAVSYLSAKISKDVKVFEEMEKIDTVRVGDEFKAYYKDEGGKGKNRREAIEALIDKP